MTLDKKTQAELYADICKAMSSLEYQVEKRNQYMRTRYNAIYGTGLYDDLDIDGWFAQYNLVGRIVDIFTAQLFGRPFLMVSNYSKEDLSAYEGDPKEAQVMMLKNKKLKADAEMRMKIEQSIIADNGGYANYENGGRIGSALGETVYKQYIDVKNKKVVRQLLENTNNVRIGWMDDNFREFNFVGYVSQLEPDTAYRRYGKNLEDGDIFQYSAKGAAFQDANGGNTGDPLSQNKNADKPQESDRLTVTEIDFTGYLSGWGLKNGKLQKVARGQETPIYALAVGGIVPTVETREKYLPKHYVIPNRIVPRQAYGASDVSDSLIEINKEIIRLEADQMAWADKNLWKIMLGKGITEESLAKLKGKSRKTKLLAIGLEQDLTEVGTSSQPLSEFARLIEQKLDLFIRIAGIGRVMLDDPTVNSGSNQALMTTLKPVVDIITTKQKIWDAALVQMAIDGQYMAATFIPGLKEVLDDDPDWSFTTEWPSVFHREDQQYQTGLLNAVNAKVMSLETFLQKSMGGDAAEELDRIRDNYKDTVTAAIMGGITGELAQQTVSPAPTTPPAPEVKYQVAVKADATTSPELNEALIRVADPSIPTPVAETGEEQAPEGMSPDQTAAPQLTQDNNSGMTASMPGTGAPAVSPEGAVATAAQNRGA